MIKSDKFAMAATASGGVLFLAFMSYAMIYFVTESAPPLVGICIVFGALGVATVYAALRTKPPPIDYHPEGSVTLSGHAVLSAIKETENERD